MRRILKYIVLCTTTALLTLGCTQSFFLEDNSTPIPPTPTPTPTPEPGGDDRIYKIGDLVSVNGYYGIVFQTEPQVKIVSTAETKTTWGQSSTTTPATNWNDGAINTAIITELPDYDRYYSAFKWCIDYLGKHWYLPARNELSAIYNQRAVLNEILTANTLPLLGIDNSNQLSDICYWSSTDDNAGKAFSINFESGSVNNSSKNTILAVRAVLVLDGSVIPDPEPEPEPDPDPTPDFDTLFGEQSVVYVKGGTFTMGATAEQGSDAMDREKPTHSVTLSDYYIGKYEVTQAQWVAIMGTNPSTFIGDNNPVDNVSWDDVQEFITKLNEKTGKMFRLPTEAEWEYAARGGNQSKGYKYSGSNNIDEVAWYTDNSSSKTYPVGQKSPNELGIYDMSGNVWEWCQDWYGSYSSSSQTNPTGPSSGSGRVVRGGSWSLGAERCRVSNRDHGSPDGRYGNHGFRLVCSPESTPEPEPTTIPNNEIWYTSTDGNVVTPNATDVFGANIVSNTYENGKGIIKFDGEVTQIGERAFENCNILASVQIPLGVTEIGMGAFANTSLTSLIIPDNVTSIGGWICSYCTSLQTVTIGNDVTSIGEGTFFNNSSLKSVYCKPKTPPTLGKEVFGQNSYNRTIYVPSVSISAYKTAVNWSEYANYIIADPNSSYDDSAESNREIWYTSTDDNTVTPYTANAFGANIISNTYENGKGVIKFDGNVTKIGESAFFGCQNLKSVTIPESVTTIENNPFAYCDNLAEFNGKFVSADKHCIIVNNVLQSFTPISLKSYSIPNSIVSISNYAFVNCQSLTQIIIPKSISSIGNRAFDYCNSLKTVYCMPDTPPTLGDNAFGASSSTRKIYVPESLVNAYKTASNWSKYSSEIEPYPGYIGPENAKTITVEIDATLDDYTNIADSVNIAHLVKGADPNSTIQMAYLDNNGMLCWQDWNITDGWFGVSGAMYWGEGCIACIKPKHDGSFEWFGLYPDQPIGTTATAIFDYGNDVVVAITVVAVEAKSEPEPEPTPDNCKIGDILTINGVKGVVFQTTPSVKMVSITETTAQWSTVLVTTGATDKDNGRSNMSVIKAIADWQSKYPAFNYCANIGEGWYIPALNELKAIYDQKDTINATLSANNMEILGSIDGILWSSCECSYGSSYCLDFAYGGQVTGDKSSINTVCAIVELDADGNPIAVPEPDINVGGFDMIFVAGGTFTMGGTDEQGSDANDSEKPTHSVTLSDYYIGKYEVTQAQWIALMGSNPSEFTGENLPVEKVSWDDIQEFITKLNAQTGKRFRLPTEAEWEYAARGGNKSEGYKYSGSDNIDEVAWYDANSGNKTNSVGQKTPNELGIYDMSGNVLEWCQDWYGDYSSEAQTNPTGPSSGSFRVLRGGGWSDYARLCRVSYRFNISPGYRNSDCGFRLAMDK